MGSSLEITLWFPETVPHTDGVSAYQQLLDATIAHMEGLKAQGVRFVPVSTESLELLVAPPRKPAASSKPPSISAPQTPLAAPETAEIPRPKPSAPRTAAAAARWSQAAQPTGTAQPAGAVASPLPPPLAGPERAAAFAALRTRVEACVKCGHLARSRKSVVFGVGDIHARILFVGEAPGADEDEQGEPFVGRAGELLTKIIQAMGLSRSQVYIANILKCRPDTPGQTSGNRKPTPEEIATCTPFLHEQINLIQPEAMVALGVSAMEGLLGKAGVNISSQRGVWTSYRGIPLMPTYHPAYLLRNQVLSEKRKVWEDMLKVMEKIGMPISEKQRGFFLIK